MKCTLIACFALLTACGAARPLPPASPAPSTPAAPALSAAPSVAAPATGETGRLVVETQPPGALVFIEGAPRGKTPLDIELPVGRHLLSLQHAGHYYTPKMIEISAGQSTAHRVRLEAAPADAYQRATNRESELRLHAAISARQSQISRCLTGFNKPARHIRGMLVIEKGAVRLDDLDDPISDADRQCILKAVRSALPDGFAGDAKMKLSYEVTD